MRSNNTAEATTRPRTWLGFATRYRALVLFFVAALILYVLGCIALSPTPTVDVIARKGDDGFAAYRHWLLGFGGSAPLVFIAMQMMQVVIAPIPGQVTALVGGHAFGWKAGLIYTTIGLSLGTFVALVLARTCGRRFVLALHAENALQDIEFLFTDGESVAGKAWLAVQNWFCTRGEVAFFLIMLLPALPDDLACFAAGLTRIPIWRLMVASILGRLPGMVVLSMFGDGASTREVRISLIVVAVASCSLTYLLFRLPKRHVSLVSCDTSSTQGDTQESLSASSKPRE